MGNYLEEFHCQKDVFSRFRACESTKKDSESLKMHFILHKQEEQESDPAWNNLSVVAKRCRVVEDKPQIKSDIAQDLVDKIGFQLHEDASPEPLLCPYIPAWQPFKFKLCTPRRSENGA
jgi:hypothetical protein